MGTRKIILFFLTGILLAVNYAFYTPQQFGEEEYNLKAAFIYRFTEYVDWGTINDENFTIEILGESAITEPLKEIVKDKKIKNKNVDVKEYHDINDIGQCEILFISKNYSGGIESALSKIGDKPVLIITEQKGDSEKGAHINFLISENKLRFEINLKAITKAGLRISSQLLQHAVLVNNL
jgi:hypothetical protein